MASKLRKPKKTKVTKPVAPAYNSLAPSFQNQGQFNQAVGQRAYGEYGPQLAEADRGIAASQRTHEQRGNQITGWSTYYGNQLKQAFEDRKNALNNLVSTNLGANQQAQGTLQAALRGSQGMDANLASMIGAPPPTGPSNAQANVMSTVNSLGQAGTNSLSTQAAAMIAEAAQRQSLSGVENMRAQEDENARYGGEQADLTGQRRSIIAGIPTATENARSAIMQEEMDKRNQATQENIANKQLGLQTQQQGFEQGMAKKEFNLKSKQFDWQKHIDEGTLAQQQQQIDQAAATATSEADARNYELQGKRWSSGVAALQSFFEPKVGVEVSKKGTRMTEPLIRNGKPVMENGKVKRVPIKVTRSPQDLYRVLKLQIQMPASEVMTLMSSINDPVFRNWVIQKRRQLAGAMDPNKMPPLTQFPPSYAPGSDPGYPGG